MKTFPIGAVFQYTDLGKNLFFKLELGLPSFLPQSPEGGFLYIERRRHGDLRNAKTTSVFVQQEALPHLAREAVTLPGRTVPPHRKTLLVRELCESINLPRQRNTRLQIGQGCSEPVGSHLPIPPSQKALSVMSAQPAQRGRGL